MIKLKLGFVLLSFLFITGCGGPDQQGSTEESIEVQMINESDSLSNELSMAGDSVEKKVKDLQATLDNLNN